MASKRAVIVLMSLGLLASALPNVPVVAATTNPAHASWAAVDSPNTGFATSTFTAVTCVSAADCWAVGSAPVEGIRTNTAITHWDGNTWGVVPSPNVAGIINRLQAVSCASSSDCWAVGITFDYHAFAEHSLVMHWDGAQWSLQELRPSSDLRGVSCPVVDDCWAVGYISSGGSARTLVEHWNGNAWNPADTSALGGGTLGLAAVSCSSASFCMAVGPATDATPRDPAAAKWDGQAWSLASTPADHPLDGNPAMEPFQQTLTGVSCTSATDCWAVGDAGFYADGVIVYAQGTLPLVDHWDGAAWTSTALPQAPQDLPAPSTSSNSHLSSVACITASDCWAVGHAMNNAGSPFDQAFTLHWDGKAWLPGPTLPDPLSTYGGDLAGIACASASACWAVGVVTPRESDYARIEQWDGTSWTSVNAPKFGVTEGNYLYDTACPSANDCWAVGFYFYGMSTRTLIEHWDGVAWTIVDSPNTAVDRRSELASVDCTSATDCWAVGESATVRLVGDPLGWDAQALFMHWDGTSWTISNPLPVDPGHTEAQLGQATGVDLAGQMTETSINSIDCVTASDCWAVGYFHGGFTISFPVGADTGWKVLFEHWDGVAWTQMPGPPTQVSPQTDFDLYDISCASASDCTAVGSQFARLEYTFNDLLNMVQPTELRDEATLIDHWDGHAWTAVPSPNLTPNINRLYGVSCSPPTCWAVGVADLDYSYSGTPRQVPIALQMDATGTWQSVDLPANTPPLDSVACTSATDCWAVGSPMSLSNPTKTATIHWDGTTWATAPSPTKLSAGKATENWLFSVSCTSGTNCFAVGQYSDGRNTQTLVLRLSSGPGTGGCPSGSSLLCGIIDILNPDVGVSITAGPLTVSGEVTLQSSPSAPAPGPDSNPLPIGGLPTGIEVGPAAAPSANPSSGDDGLLGVLLRFFGLGHGTPAAPVEGLPAAPIGLPVATQPSSAAQAGAQSPAASQRVVLLLDGVEVGHDDVATSEAAPTDAWSIDTAVAAGAHLLHATWTDGDGETIASAERAITVSAGDCAADDNTCVPVDNHAPVVDTVLSTLQTVANDLPATIGLSGGAHDDNGIGDSSGKIAAAAGSVSVSSIQRGTTPICLGTGAGCIIVDAATVEGVAGSPTDVTYSLGLGLPAGLAEGTYTVTVTATDSAGLTGGKTVAFEAYAPGGFVLHIDGGALHFGDAIAPGQAATSSNFVLVHNTHKDTDGVFAPADLRFQMSPFRSASGEQFTAVDHLILGIDPTGAGDFTAGNAQAFTVDYSSSLQSLSQMPADGSWAIQLTLAVPVGTGAGSYGSTFGVA